MPLTQCPLCRGGVESLDPEVVVGMECSICNEDVTRAVPLRPCGHMFCSTCCERIQPENVPVEPAPSAEIVEAEETVDALHAHWKAVEEELRASVIKCKELEERAAEAARPYIEGIHMWSSHVDSLRSESRREFAKMQSAERWLGIVRKRAHSAAIIH